MAFCKLKPVNLPNHILTKRAFLSLGLISGIGALYLSLRGLFSFLQQPASRAKPSRFPLTGWKELNQNPARTRFLRGVWLIRDEQGWYGLTNICTHLGCQPAWDSKNELLVCPCHGSRFNLKGEVLKGPAIRPLSRPYLWVKPNQEIWVDLQRTVDRHFRVGT